MAGWALLVVAMGRVALGGAAIADETRQRTEHRVDELLKRMTIDEMAGQCNQGGFGPYEKYMRSKTGLGHLVMQQGGGIDSRKAAARANELQKIAVEETRLGIPLLIGCDGILDARVADATTFPQQIAMGATWNPDLVRRAYRVIAVEMRSVGYGRTYGPNVGIARDPRFGRTGETYGEDTYHVSRMAEAAVAGLAGPTLETGIMATPKHFVAYDATIGGRDSSGIDVSERTLREVWLPPFKSALDSGAGAVMCAYHAINGVPCAASSFLLTNVLRTEWGFDGFVVTDFMCVRSLWDRQHVAGSFDEASRIGFEAGVDVYDHDIDDDFAPRLARLVREGTIAMSILDRAARRTLRAKHRLGLFDRPYVDPEEATRIVGQPGHRELTLQVARESIVLLKNEGGLLPLAKDLGAVAVIGPNADSIKNQLGVWVKLVVPERASGVVTILQGIRGKVAADTLVHHVAGCGVMPGSDEDIERAVEAARKSDVAIVVVGDSPDLNAETHDRADLDLTGHQDDLVKAVFEAGTPTVVVLVNARPLTINRIAETIPAIVEAWKPGERGGTAVAEVLFGETNPGGKLPISFPRSTGQLPVHYNLEPGWHAENYVCGTPGSPLYPFGFGLSYTTFEYGDPRLTPASIGVSGKTVVSVDVMNTGARKGDEVVQLYVHDRVASMVRPRRELKGFKRISLEPGEKKTVNLALSADQLDFYNREMKRVVEPGVFDVMVGTSSADVKTVELEVR